MQLVILLSPEDHQRQAQGASNLIQGVLRDIVWRIRTGISRALPSFPRQHNPGRFFTGLLSASRIEDPAEVHRFTGQLYRQDYSLSASSRNREEPDLSLSSYMKSIPILVKIWHIGAIIQMSLIAVRT